MFEKFVNFERGRKGAENGHKLTLGCRFTSISFLRLRVILSRYHPFRENQSQREVINGMHYILVVAASIA